MLVEGLSFKSWKFYSLDGRNVLSQFGVQLNSDWPTCEIVYTPKGILTWPDIPHMVPNMPR